MNLRRLTLSLTFTLIASLAAATAHAQIGVYGTFNATRLTGIPYSTTNFAGTTVSGKGSFNVFGGTGGAYYDFHNYGPVKLGVDLRGTISSSKKSVYPNAVVAGSHLDSALLGLRAVFHTPLAPLHPYVQASAGLGRTDYGKYVGGVPPYESVHGGVVYVNNLQVEGFAGLDVRVFPVMDVRVLEYGFGMVHGTGNSAGNYPIQSVSSGIVFHLPF